MKNSPSARKTSSSLSRWWHLAVFFESFQKKLDAIPKVIVPEDKANYEYLLEKCDIFAQRNFGRIHGVVDYTQHAI